MKVCKFGGTSMADANAINQVADIILSDPSRKFVIVSAPGKRYKDDIKVTDLFYEAYAAAQKVGKCDAVFTKIANRYNEIVFDLHLTLNLAPYFETIVADINGGADSDYCASRGEYLSAIILANRLGFEFIDAAALIKFFDDGRFDSEYTNDIASRRLESSNGAVIPGFYGMIEGCRIKTFSRGGSDVSGAIIARAARASVYENWTDVDGFLMCDPRIVKNPAHIRSLTYQELRELSYMGASVLHPDSIFPVRGENIPINIRNTFNPTHPGTLILPTERRDAPRYPITGIVGKHNFLAFHIEKSMMNNECGFVRRALTVLEHYRINVEHLPSGIDTVTLVIDGTQVTDALLATIVSELKGTLATDHITLERNISLIATVGHGMAKRKGTAAMLCEALRDAGINILMIDQGSSELNIIVAVSTPDCDRAINAIYHTFVKSGQTTDDR